MYLPNKVSVTTDMNFNRFDNLKQGYTSGSIMPTSMRELQLFWLLATVNQPVRHCDISTVYDDIPLLFHNVIDYPSCWSSDTHKVYKDTDIVLCNDLSRAWDMPLSETILLFRRMYCEASIAI